MFFTASLRYRASDVAKVVVTKKNQHRAFMCVQKICCTCFVYRPVTEFYRRPNGQHQAKCKICQGVYQRERRIKLKEGALTARIDKPKIAPVPRSFYYVPPIYIVGYDRTQSYQHACLSCGKEFFCIKDDKDLQDLFCDRCEVDESKITQEHKSPVPCIGRCIGWLVKSQGQTRKRNARNFKAVFIRDNFTCQYCGYNLENATEFQPLHIDHIKPWCAGGNNSLNNLVVACQRCNLKASGHWFASFTEKKDYILDAIRKP